jgi:cytochrome c-type biogenesis protein CcsB
MELAVIISSCFYLCSTGCYVAYLFLQKNYLHRWGFFLLLAGFISHSTGLLIAFGQSGHLPARNLYETLSVAGWAVAGVFLLFQYKFNLKILGVFAAPLAALIMVVATQLPKVPPESKAIFSSFWLIFHVIAIFLGEAAFAMACGVGILYLVQENAIKTKKHGFFYRRLPSLELLDSTGYVLIITGFTLLTIGLATGFIYAKAIWGKFLSWDPKEIWSGVTWLLYAALLHERLTSGWRGRKSAIMAIVGFLVILFTFFGVNFFLEGHHGGFTRL